MRGCKVCPAGRSREPGVPCAPVGGVVAAHDELAVGIGLALADLDLVVLACGTQGIVESHGCLAHAELCGCDPGPGIRMAEDGSVFLDALVDSCDESDLVVRCSVAGSVEVDTPLAPEVLVYGFYCLSCMLAGCKSTAHCPGVGLQMHLAFHVGVRSYLLSALGEATDIPVAVPEFALAGGAHLFKHFLIVRNLIFSTEVLEQVDELVDCPEVQERNKCALSATEVQTVVPVGSQAQTDSVASDLLGTECKDLLHVLEYRALPAVGIAEDLIQETKVSGLANEFTYGWNEPQGIVAAGVLQTVNHACGLGSRLDRRALEGNDLRSIRIEDLRAEQVQAVARGCQATKQLDDSLLALVRIGRNDAHCILCGVPISQSGSPADLDE